MCGIIGYLDKRGGTDRPIGHTLLSMLQALSCRGPDSAGVALFGPRQGAWILQIKLPDNGDTATAASALLNSLRDSVAVIRHGIVGAYLRLEVEHTADPAALERQLLARSPGCEVVSLGHQLEIIKQVGSPVQLEQTYAISQKTGTHGIGHTRLSTESRVDLSHGRMACPTWRQFTMAM